MKAARVRRPKPAWLVAAIATGALLSGCQNQVAAPTPTPTPATGPVTVGASTVDVTAGASGTVAMKVASSSPLTGTLALKLKVTDPSGAAASGFTIRPTTVQAGGQSSLDVQVTVAAPAGSAPGIYKATVTVTNTAFQGSASFAIVVASAAHQGTCTLDPSFGSNGSVTTNLGTALAGINSLEVQSSGKLVVGMASGLGTYLLARLNVDGSLDGSFGHGGFVNTHFFDNSPLWPFSAAGFLANGDILVAGVGAITASNASKSTLRLAEYGPDGAPNTAFGSGGVVDTGIAAYEAHAVLPLQDGSVLVLASGFPGGGVLLHVAADGTLDSSFGNGGVVRLDQMQYPSALAVQSSGRILIGDAVTSTPTVYAYTAAGAVDTSFGNGGTVALGPTGNAYWVHLAVLPDDSVVVAGSDSLADTTTLFELNAGGALDTAFGTNGSATAPSDADALLLDASGRIYVAGHAWTSSPSSAAAVSRLTASGTLDASFGSGGTSTFAAYPGGLNWANAIALNAQGDVVLAGITASSTAGTNYGPGAQQGMVAEMNGSGALISSFGASGLAAVRPPADDFPGFVLVKPGGGIVVGGVTYRQYGEGLLASFAAYDASGSLDPAYGTGGISTTVTTAMDLSFGATALDPQGRIVASTATGVLRALPGGGLDPAFGSGGILTTAFWPGPYQNGPGTVAVLPDSSLVVGETPYFGVTNTFVLAHLSASGTLDAAFGSNGFASFQAGTSNTMLHALFVRSNGKILAAGESIEAGVAKWVVAQFDPNGSLDTSFGTHGSTVIGATDPTFNGSVHALAVTATGKVLVLGAGAAGGKVGFVAARLDADGTLDSTFGAQGVARVGVGSSLTGSSGNDYAARVESGGSILMATEVDATLYLARLTADGAPDDSFSAGGFMPATITPGNGLGQFLGGTGSTSLAIGTGGSLLAARAVDGPIDRDFGVWRCVPH